MKRLAQSTRGAVVTLCLCVTAARLHVQPGWAQSAPELPYESKFIDAGGVRLHYLDFGGKGLALVFVHSESWDAYTYAKFAPRFSDAYRVLAVTRPGYGQSEDPGYGYDVSAQAERLIDFLDAVGIRQAVFAGNSAPSKEMTYLAEHHVERVAGLIYLAGPPPFGSEEVVDSDPTEAYAMSDRGDYDAPALARRSARRAYRPDYLRGDRPTIQVPALGFVDRGGTGDGWGLSYALARVGSPRVADIVQDPRLTIEADHLRRLITDKAYRNESLDSIPDPVARAYFRRLAEDDELQAEVLRYHQQVIQPSILASQRKFKHAFGDHLEVVQLDVPLVTGYAYRDSPEVIYSQIRLFLEKIRESEDRVESSHSYETPPRLNDGWSPAPPERLGLARAPLEEMTEAITRGEYANVHAVLIAKDGHLFYEEYFNGIDRRWLDNGTKQEVPTVFGRDTLHGVRSVTKSVTSAAFGLALADGAIESLDQPLFDFFPDFGRPIATEPGERWTYSGGLTTLLGYVVSRATGKSFGTYAREKLFEPLGITQVEWGWAGERGEGRVGTNAWLDISEFQWRGSQPWSLVASPFVAPAIC